MKRIIFLIVFFSVFAWAATDTVLNTYQLKMREAGGPDKITIQPPSLGSSYTLTLPTSGGTNNYTLHTNGSGTTSWDLVSLASSVSGTLPLANGGTSGSLAAVNGGAVYSTAGAMAITAAGTSGNALVSSGAGAPAWGAISLASANGVSGTLPLANGGTSGSLSAVNGGVVYSTAGAMAISAAGTSGQVLHSAGAGTPTWGAVALATEVSGTLPVANGGTGASSTFFVVADFTGTNPDLGTASVADYTEMTNTDGTLTPSANSSEVGIMCSGTNAATAASSSPTTCAAGNESIGINFAAGIGWYEVCFYGTHIAQADSNVTLDVAFQVIETPTDAQTLTQECGPRIATGIRAENISGGVDSRSNFPFAACGQCYFASSGTKGVRLMYEQLVSGTPDSSRLVTDAAATVGARRVRVTAKRVF